MASAKILLRAAALSTMYVIVDGANATLVMFPDAPAAGAMCLDGSAPGIYLRPSFNGSTKWILNIEGGGWSFNETSTYQRSLTALGSSKYWTPSVPAYGIEDDDCGNNPSFCDWNLAYLPYCDGMSFSGDREDPIIFINGSFNASLWARGHRTLQYTLNYLKFNTSFGAAPEVIVDGCSAGGLSVYLHIDEIATYAAPNARVVGVGDAGFFGDLPTVTDVFYSRSLITYEFPMHNATAGMMSTCLADRSPDAAWQCFTPQVALPYVQHPLFLLQSDFDSYQLQNIFAPTWLPGVDPAWGGCVWNPSGCDASQQAALLGTWMPQFRSILKYAGVFSQGDYGMRATFLHSCFSHCQWGAMHTYAINGTQMYDAFVAWYTLAYGIDGNYAWVDCDTWGCNPTCGA